MDKEQDQDQEQKENFIQIPLDMLKPDILDALVEEFILREGTDYGQHEIELSEKKSRLHKQLQTGKVVILFSSLTENTTLMNFTDFKRLS